MKTRPAKRNGRWLRNRLSKHNALEKLRQENFDRRTVSFYRYVNLGTIDEVQNLRDELFIAWDDLGCLGRVYIAPEGINAQMSVPVHHWDTFVEQLYDYDVFNKIPFKIGLQEGESFWKLAITVKNQIVADGLTMDDYDIANVGKHLDARAFNAAMSQLDTIVVDMRNNYESRIGHFDGAVTPDAETFREELPMVADMLKERTEDKVLLYCTGGIRCEKASAYLKSKGFKDVNQLHGGIVSYTHQVEKEGLENKFHGANLVFDGRNREQVSKEIISTCDICKHVKTDWYINCKNSSCNKLLLACPRCKHELDGYCSKKCKNEDFS